MGQAGTTTGVDYKRMSLDELEDVRQTKLDQWLANAPPDAKQNITAFVDGLIAHARGDTDF